MDRHDDLPSPQELGPDPEPIGTDRFELLLARSTREPRRTVRPAHGRRRKARSGTRRRRGEEI